MDTGKIVTAEAGRKPKIAWISPLAPQGALSCAEFSLATLPTLAEQFDIECFVDDLDLEHASIDLPCFHYHRLFERSRAQNFTAYIFQLENSLRCQFVRLCAQVYPGITYLHDTAFNQLYYGLYQFTTAPTELNSLVQKEFGKQAPCIGDFHVRRWSYEVFNRQYACGSTDLLKLSHVAVFRRDHLKQLQAYNSSLSAKLSHYPLQTISNIDRETKRRSNSNTTARIVFTGENYLADRCHSFLAACSALKAKRNEIEFYWCHRSEKKHTAAREYCSRFEQTNNAKNIDVQHRVVTNAELRELLLSKNSIFVSLRTDQRAAWPIGVTQALETQTAIVACSTQFADINSSRQILLLPEGAGDELWLEKTLDALIDSQSYIKENTKRITEDLAQQLLVASTKEVAEEITSNIKELSPKLNKECAEANKRIENRINELLARPAKDSIEPVGTFVEELFEQYINSMPLEPSSPPLQCVN